MATAQKSKPKITPTFAPSTREELERKREGVVATAPSGARFRIRAVPLLRHALAGGLPQKLRQLALDGNRGITKLLAGSDEQIKDGGAQILDYMDEVVLASIMEPELTKDDVRSGGLSEQPLIHPRDYAWLFAVANADEDRDAQGRLLWGEPPLDLTHVYAEAHGCAPDCEECVQAWSSLRANP
jgi:hypothetical protein